MSHEMSDEASVKTEPGLPRLPPKTRAPACVLQIYGGMLGRRFELGTGDVVIGRDEENKICVDLTDVSRRHARLYEQDGGAWVEDLDSTNGTLVNDVRIDGPRQLCNGDHLMVGGAVFKFIEGGNLEALYHEELHRITITDGLTGAATKRAFVEFLDRELLRTKRHARPLSLVMFDIDDFKQVNDKYGHLAGDHVLRGVAAAVRGEVRGDELFARYGGDEFSIVLPETMLDDAARFCERIRAKVETQSVAWQGQLLHVTISIGAASIEPDDDQAAFLARADRRLYEAKRTGRNRCVLA
jgi:diguanylate cyclase (GGDEF)-like protein